MALLRNHKNKNYYFSPFALVMVVLKIGLLFWTSIIFAEMEKFHLTIEHQKGYISTF